VRVIPLSNGFFITVHGEKMELIVGKRYQFDIADQLSPITGTVMDLYFAFEGMMFFYVWDENDHEDYQIRDADVLTVIPL
jgi:hypothetical protein